MKVDPSGPVGSPPPSPPRHRRQTDAPERPDASAVLRPEARPQTRAISPAVAAEIARAGHVARLGTGDMRREMTRLLESIDAVIPDPRAARVAAWVLKGEVHKLDVLDGFVGGYIRG